MSTRTFYKCYIKGGVALMVQAYQGYYVEDGRFISDSALAALYVDVNVEVAI